VRFDRKRKGKTLSNADWKSPTDPDARIAKMKDGTTHLAYKPEHAVDLDTGVIVAAPIRPADQGDATTLAPTLEAAARNPRRDRAGADQGRALRRGRRQRLSFARTVEGARRRRMEDAHRRAGAGQRLLALAWRRRGAAGVYANRARLKSGIGRETMRRRGELVERSFAHVLDRGGMRRAWLRGRENVHKRYLIHVALRSISVS